MNLEFFMVRLDSLYMAPPKSSEVLAKNSQFSIIKSPLLITAPPEYSKHAFSNLEPLLLVEAGEFLHNKVKVIYLFKLNNSNENHINMKLINSFKYAIEGLINTANVERNLKIHLTATVCVIILGLIVKLSKMEWVICIILIGLVITAELFNTALEKTLDYINEDYDADIKFIKDTSAAAVLVMAISSAIIGLMIFLPKLL